MSNISGVIKSIQDIMRKDVGVDGDAQRIGQMVWMFFLKIYDDRETELELIESDFKSAIPDHLRWRNWAANAEGITGDALADFVNLQLFPKLKTDPTAQGALGQRAQLLRDVFEDAYNYMKSGTLMRQVINKINEIDFNNSEDRHTFGAIYEQVLKDLQSAGNAGEFYTPRAVTRFIIDRLDLKLNEIVLDPACGTGGFLTCAIDHKRKSVHSTADEETLRNSIRGVEKKALPHMLCITNMILHGIDTPSGIVHGNTLAKPYREYGDKDRVHVIATNPPFGGMEEDGIENNFPAHLRTRETAARTEDSNQPPPQEKAPTNRRGGKTNSAPHDSRRLRNSCQQPILGAATHIDSRRSQSGKLYSRALCHGSKDRRSREQRRHRHLSIQ